MKKENYELMEKIHLKKAVAVLDTEDSEESKESMKDALALADRMIEIDKLNAEQVKIENEKKIHPKDVLQVAGTILAAAASAVVKGLFDRAINNDSIRSRESIAEKATNFEKDGTYTTTAAKVVIRESLVK